VPERAFEATKSRSQPSKESIRRRRTSPASERVIVLQPEFVLHTPEFRRSETTGDPAVTGDARSGMIGVAV
jgi:hypothetical protein